MFHFCSKSNAYTFVGNEAESFRCLISLQKTPGDFNTREGLGPDSFAILAQLSVSQILLNATRVYSYGKHKTSPLRVLPFPFA